MATGMSWNHCFLCVETSNMPSSGLCTLSIIFGLCSAGYYALQSLSASWNSWTFLPQRSGVVAISRRIAENDSLLPLMAVHRSNTDQRFSEKATALATSRRCALLVIRDYLLEGSERVAETIRTGSVAFVPVQVSAAGEHGA